MKPEDILVPLFIVNVLCAFAATFAGPSRYSGRLLVLTLLFMGPLGVAAALIMKAIEDFAPRNIGQSPTPADLSPIKLKTKPDAAEEPPSEKRTVRCLRCNAELFVAVDAVRFKCAKCKEISKVPN